MRDTIDKTGIITLIIIAGNLITFLINIAVGGGNRLWLFLSGGGDVMEWGQVAFQAVMVNREWWRLLTCGYIHCGVFHLFFNLYALYLFGGTLEKHLGHGKTFVFYHVGLAITAFLWCLLFPNGSTVGASMGIFVALGMFVTMSRLEKTEELQLSIGRRNYLIGYVVLGCLLGIGTIVVHAIGFGVGVLFGYLCMWQKGRNGGRNEVHTSL